MDAINCALGYRVDFRIFGSFRCSPAAEAHNTHPLFDLDVFGVLCHQNVRTTITYRQKKHSFNVKWFVSACLFEQTILWENSEESKVWSLSMSKNNKSPQKQKRLIATLKLITPPVQLGHQKGCFFLILKPWKPASIVMKCLRKTIRIIAKRVGQYCQLAKSGKNHSQGSLYYQPN